MTKAQLIKKLSSKLHGYQQEDIEKSVSLILKKISDSLSKGDRVEVRNFGTFSIRNRGKRISRNPKTGSSVQVNSKYHPYFRASKNLRESLNT